MIEITESLQQTNIIYNLISVLFSLFVDTVVQLKIIWVLIFIISYYLFGLSTALIVTASLILTVLFITTTIIFLFVAIGYKGQNND